MKKKGLKKKKKLCCCAANELEIQNPGICNKHQKPRKYKQNRKPSLEFQSTRPKKREETKKEKAPTSQSLVESKRKKEEWQHQIPRRSREIPLGWSHVGKI